MFNPFRRKKKYPIVPVKPQPVNLDDTLGQDLLFCLADYLEVSPYALGEALRDLVKPYQENGE